MIKKYYLLSPGPTPIPDKVLSVAAEPIIHHRTPEFSAIFMEVTEGLKSVFQTKEDAAECGFTAPAFSHETKDLPFLDMKSDAVDRVDELPMSLGQTQHPRVSFEEYLQVVDFNERHECSCRCLW